MADEVVGSVWDKCDAIYDDNEHFIGRKMEPTFIPLASSEPLLVVWDAGHDDDTYCDGSLMAPKETDISDVDQPMISFDACNDYMDFFLAMYRNGHMTYEAASLGLTTYQILEQE